MFGKGNIVTIDNRRNVWQREYCHYRQQKDCMIKGTLFMCPGCWSWSSQFIGLSVFFVLFCLFFWSVCPVKMTVTTNTSCSNSYFVNLPRGKWTSKQRNKPAITPWPTAIEQHWWEWRNYVNIVMILCFCSLQLLIDVWHAQLLSPLQMTILGGCCFCK